MRRACWPDLLALAPLAFAWLACAPPPPPALPPTPAASVPGPLRLLSHADPPVELLAFDHRRSRGLVTSLGPVVDAVNRDRSRDRGVPPLELTLLQWRYDRGSAPIETSETRVHRLELDTRFDVWLQDVAELAVEPASGGAPGFVLVDPRRGAGLERFVPTLALRWGARWVRLAPARPGSASGGGNVEVLPNDLLLLGSTVGETMAGFWLERGYASHHVRVDTSWLAVGHVDEILSHVVLGPGPCDYALVRAAPARALALAAADPDPPRWLRRRGDSFARHQRAIEGRIAASVDAIARAIASGVPACPAPTVIEAPVLFRCEGEGDAPRACESERPNSVNMTVLDRHLLVPDPRYEPFARALRSALEAHGQHVHLLDADAPHRRRGGLHCATTVRRIPRASGPAAATIAP